MPMPANLTLEAGERCLMGRNGAGKAALVKVIAGEVKVDREIPGPSP